MVGGGAVVAARDVGVFSIVEFAFLVLVGNDGGVDGRGGVMKFGVSLFFVSDGWFVETGACDEP